MEFIKTKHTEEKAAVSKCPYCEKVNIIISDNGRISDYSVRCNHWHMLSGDNSFYNSAGV